MEISSTCPTSTNSSGRGLAKFGGDWNQIASREASSNFGIEPPTSLPPETTKLTLKEALRSAKPRMHRREETWKWIGRRMHEAYTACLCHATPSGEGHWTDWTSRFQTRISTFDNEGTLTKAEHDELWTIAAESNPDNFLREASYWTMKSQLNAQVAQKTQTINSNNSWATKVRTEMKEGTSWAHKMSKVIEPRQHKPVLTADGPSLAASDLLQDQIKTWEKWWKVQPQQADPLDNWKIVRGCQGRSQRRYHP